MLTNLYIITTRYIFFFFHRHYTKNEFVNNGRLQIRIAVINKEFLLLLDFTRMYRIRKMIQMVLTFVYHYEIFPLPYLNTNFCP